MYIDTTRDKDKVSEKEINFFLHRFFYKKKFKKVELVEDKNRQEQGIDFIADGLLIDNKAQSSPRYINHPTETFSLELISHTKTGEEYIGWYLNPNLITTHYLFVWIPDANVNSGSYLTSSKQINKLEVMLVDKNRLTKYLNQYCSNERLYEAAKNMIGKTIDKKIIIEFGLRENKAPYFCYSYHLNEHPVNLVVNKEWLKKCAIAHCYVTSDEIINI